MVHPVLHEQVFCVLCKVETYSTKDVAHALEICDVLAECDMTLKMKGKTDGTAGRATTARRAACITWMGDFRGCSSRGQEAWLIGVCVRASLENTTRQTWSRR